MKKTMKRSLCALLAALLSASLLASCGKKPEEHSPSGVSGNGTVADGEKLTDGETVTDVELDLPTPAGTGRRNIDEEDPMPYEIDGETENALLEGVDDFFMPIFFPEEETDLAPELIAFGRQFADDMRAPYLEGYRAVYTKMEGEGLLRSEQSEALLKKMEDKLTETMFYRTGDVVFQDDDHATMNCCLSVSNLFAEVFFGDADGNMSFGRFCEIAGINWDAIKARLDAEEGVSDEQKRANTQDVVYGLLDAAIDDIAVSVFGQGDYSFCLALEKQDGRWVTVDAY